MDGLQDENAMKIHLQALDQPNQQGFVELGGIL